MKLLVFADPPPPVHGQSLMVRTLLDGLPAVAPEIEILSVAPRLSRNAADIGRWRPGKLPALLRAAARVWRLRRRHGPLVLYYVPAPGKRAALYRDLCVMALCRPGCSALVLHWHAAGLGAWLATHATAPERWLARLLLGRADLALVLAPSLTADAAALGARRTLIVPNGLADPAGAAEPPRARSAEAPQEILFLGLATRSKGLFAALEGVALAAAREPGRHRLTVAGDFADAAEAAEFRARAAALGPDVVRVVGFADEAEKRRLFGAADLFCLPTTYPHEAQPLALLEALAWDRPIVTTRWRAIPELLPPDSAHVYFVDPARPEELADAFVAARKSSGPAGAHRAHYLARFTTDRHLAALAAALGTLAPLNAARPAPARAAARP